MRAANQRVVARPLSQSEAGITAHYLRQRGAAYLEQPLSLFARGTRPLMRERMLSVLLKQNPGLSSLRFC